MCPIRRFEIEKERDKEVINGKLEEFRLATFRKPKSLDDWANMFEMIYKNVHYGAPIEKICFHFMEEVGEVAKAIRKLNYYSKKDMGCLTSDERTDIEKLRRDMQNEIADVFSWIVSLKMKLNFLSQVILKYHKHYYENVELHIIKLSDSVWNIFQTPDGTELFCPHCRKKVCKCPII
jgi:NTP pyrophosphatase (non-canonical NTP hydrolase)